MTFRQWIENLRFQPAAVCIESMPPRLLAEGVTVVAQEFDGSDSSSKETVAVRDMHVTASLYGDRCVLLEFASLDPFHPRGS